MRGDLKGTLLDSYLTLCISLFLMLYTYMECHGRSSPSPPPNLTTHTNQAMMGEHCMRGDSKVLGRPPPHP